ncbi:Rv1733c family protein [Williamsia sp. M5A3_1d]
MSGERRSDARRAMRRANARHHRGANPLEREIDITERRMHRLLVLVGMILLPLAIVPGILIWSSHQDDPPQKRIDTVSATTDLSSAAVTPITSTIGSDESNKVPAHWTYKGAAKSGVITVPPGTAAGSSLLLTVDQDGRPTPPMPLRADAGVTAVAVVIVLIGLVIATLLALQNWIRTYCDRKRDVMWDKAITDFFAPQ